MLAAFDLYSKCSPCYLVDHALDEQQAVHDAFTAIGYGGYAGYEYCPCP